MDDLELLAVIRSGYTGCEPLVERYRPDPLSSASISEKEREKWGFADGQIRIAGFELGLENDLLAAGPPSPKRLDGWTDPLRSSDKLRCSIVLPGDPVRGMFVGMTRRASTRNVYKTVACSTVFRARSRPVFYLRQLTPPTQNTLHNERLDPHLPPTPSPGRQLRCSSLASSQTLDRVPQVSRLWARFASKRVYIRSRELIFPNLVFHHIIVTDRSTATAPITSTSRTTDLKL
jgi:hypothetical protein